MSKRTAILQTSADTTTATEALDVALALASMDQPVQLILLDEATTSLHGTATKRYGMLELLDAEPVLLCADAPQQPPASVEVDYLKPEQLAEHLTPFDEVLQFS